MSEELKPCPHCGCQACILEEFHEEIGRIKFRVGCKNCLAITFSLYDTKAEAIEAWNEYAEILPCGKS